jgi:hypothetical protein
LTANELPAFGGSVADDSATLAARFEKLLDCSVNMLVSIELSSLYF